MEDAILVVDDDRSIRGVVCEVLRDDGYAVVEATSGQEALEHYLTGGFGLVITDIRMPGLDGIELLRELREANELVHVVIMTSHASMQTAVSALKAGAFDYLVKPFESLDLISDVARRGLEAARNARRREKLVTRLAHNNRRLERLTGFFRELAIRDGLTGLFNHRYLQEILNTEVERAERYNRLLSLIFVDVDHFKSYNDTHGHQAGDEVLKIIGQLLDANIRETDTAARWGGEEFLILAPETALEDVEALAQKLREVIARHAFEGMESQPEGRITISAGVAQRRPGECVQALVDRADRAVYEAKARGRNEVIAAA